MWPGRRILSCQTFMGFVDVLGEPLSTPYGSVFVIQESLGKCASFRYPMATIAFSDDMTDI
jgi:hypothetical protein